MWLHWPVMIDDLIELRTSRNMISTFGHLKEQFTQKSFTHPHVASNPHDLLSLAEHICKSSAYWRCTIKVHGHWNFQASVKMYLTLFFQINYFSKNYFNLMKKAVNKTDLYFGKKMPNIVQYRCWPLFTA